MGHDDANMNAAEALGAASDAVQGAISEWTITATPATLAAMNRAIRAFIDALSRVVGPETAVECEAAFQVFNHAIARQASLTATLSSQPTMDEADVAMTHQLAADQAVALQAWEAALAAAVSRLPEN